MLAAMYWVPGGCLAGARVEEHVSMLAKQDWERQKQRGGSLKGNHHRDA
jgi:hypothetical protein